MIVKWRGRCEKNGRKVEIFVNKTFCKGCTLCIEVCPTKVFVLSKDLSEKGVHYPVPSNVDKCTICRRCEIICPDFAISVEEVS